MIKAKINVTAIDKAKLFKGAKGTYLDVCLIETPNDQYGNDYMIVQDVSKEEREAGVKGAILGNAKTLGQSQPSRPPRHIPDKQKYNTSEEDLDEEIPF